MNGLMKWMSILLYSYIPSNFNMYFSKLLKGSASNISKVFFYSLLKQKLNTSTSIHIPTFKKPCHKWSSQPFFATSNHLLQLATTRCNEWLKGSILAGFFESWFIYYCRDLEKRKVPGVSVYEGYLYHFTSTYFRQTF